MRLRGLFAVALLASCFAASARKPVAPPSPVSPQLDVELVLSQNEVGVEVPATASQVGMQFGLIGALVGTAIQDQQAKNAEARIVPVRNLLVEYDFNQRVESALRDRLASPGLSPDPRLRVSNAPDSTPEVAGGRPVTAEVLILIPRWAMDYDFGALTVYLQANLIERQTKPNGKVKVAVKFARSYSYSFPMHSGARGERDRKWAELGSDRLTALVDEAVVQLGDMLAFDFSNEGRATWQAKIGDKEFVRVNDVGFPGRSLRQAPDWAWVRVGKGWPMIKGYHPIVASTYGSTDKPVDAVPEAPVATPPAGP